MPILTDSNERAVDAAADSIFRPSHRAGYKSKPLQRIIRRYLRAGSGTLGADEVAPMLARLVAYIRFLRRRRAEHRDALRALTEAVQRYNSLPNTFTHKGMVNALYRAVKLLD